MPEIRMLVVDGVERGRGRKMGWKGWVENEEPAERVEIGEENAS